MAAGLASLSDFAAHARDIVHEARRLAEVEAWALTQLPVSDGDAVTLKRAPANVGPGWAPYREVLVKGSTGTIHDLYLYQGEWRGLFQPDVCWAISSWKDQRLVTVPKGFMLGLHYMRRRKASDAGLALPVDAIDRPRRAES
jgi:hypothetical protein